MSNTKKILKTYLNLQFKPINYYLDGLKGWNLGSKKFSHSYVVNLSDNLRICYIPPLFVVLVMITQARRVFTAKKKANDTERVLNETNDVHNVLRRFPCRRLLCVLHSFITLK